MLFVACSDRINVWDLKKGKLLQTIRDNKAAYFDLALGKKEDWFAAIDQYGYLSVFEKRGKKYTLSRKFKYKKSSLNSIDISIKDLIVLGQERESISVVTKNGKKLWAKPERKKYDAKGKFIQTDGTCAVQFNKAGDQVLSYNTGNIALHDLSGNEIWKMKRRSNTNVCDATFVQERFIAVTKGNYIELWDWRANRKVATYGGHEDDVRAVASFKDSHLLVSGDDDGVMRLINIKNGYSAGVVQQKGEWVIYDNRGYFDASIKGGNILSFAKGLESYPVDQFSVYFNRPDLIFSNLEIGGEDYIAHLNELYKNRINKSFAKQLVYSPEITTPSIKVVSKRVSGEKLNLTFEIDGLGIELANYQIYKNGVPEFLRLGKQLKGKVAKISETLSLLDGENFIEISAFNAEGSESLRKGMRVKHRSTQKPNIYLVGLGVSKYRDQKLNLDYAAKDVKDLSLLFRKKIKGANKVHSKLLLNEEVTKENFARLRGFLSSASPNDIVILSISGHGAYERNKLAEYYFLSHDANIGNLSERGISWTSIEELLYSVKANKKLVFIDTCESGDIDIGIQVQAFKRAKELGFYSRARNILSDIKNKTKKRRKYLYNKDRFIYNDIFKGSGSIIFSSSKGGEMSYESKKLKNGFFTSSIVRALSRDFRASDVNRDGYVDINELISAVSVNVAQATGGLQNPTVDKGNPHLSLRFSR